MGQRSLVFKILGVIVGVVFLVYGVVERSSVSRIKSGGETAVVQPITEYTMHKSRGNITYTAQFTFRTSSGVKVTRKTSFPKEILEDFQHQRPVKVFYDPRDPREFVFEKQESSWFLVGTGMGIALLALVLT